MKSIALIACYVVSATAFAQTFPLETLRDNGDPSNRINLVFLSDGYTASELDTYIEDVELIVSAIFKQSPFKEYKNYFNIYAIKVPSVESGASHPRNTFDDDCTSVPMMTVDNYFGSSFDSYGIHRLLVPTRMDLISSVLASNVPMYDQAFILVNTPYYGGSGGMYATASTDPYSAEVSIHEIGHSFAGLADEYWAGDSYAIEMPNLTQEDDPTKVRWKSWIGDNQIGIYSHEESPLWYRPHESCKMRYLNQPFCSVCKENFVEIIHELVNPLVSYSPVDETLDINEGSMEFSVQLDKPTTNMISVTWMKNDVVMNSEQDKDHITLPGALLVPGENTLKAIVVDDSPMTRNKSHLTSHVYEIEWTITANIVLGAEITSTLSEYDVSIFPNPVDKEINISYSLQASSPVLVELSDATGRILKTILDENQSEGKHSLTVQTEGLNMKSAGLYYLALKINEVKVIQKLIRR